MEGTAAIYSPNSEGIWPWKEFNAGKGCIKNVIIFWNLLKKILSEVDLMFQRINKEIVEGKEVNIGQHLDINIGSIINNLLFGYRFDDVCGQNIPIN